MSKLSLDNIMKSVVQAKETTDVLKFRPHEEILSLSLIETNPENVFAENDGFAEIEELADDIQLNGLMHPLVINKKDGHFRLISGERRFRALQKLRYDNVRCTVYNDIDSAAELRMLYAANLKARTYSPSERIKYYEQLKEILTRQKAAGEYAGPIKSGIAGMMGVSDRQVRKYDRISENLNNEDRQKLEKGGISVEEAYRIAQGKTESGSNSGNHQKAKQENRIHDKHLSEFRQSSSKPSATGKATEIGSASGYEQGSKQTEKESVSVAYTGACDKLRELIHLFNLNKNIAVSNKLNGIILKLNEIMENEGYHLREQSKDD